MKYWVIFFSFVISFSINAQVLENGGATSTGMAGLNVISSNVWSSNNNIGQLANIKSSAISVSVFQPFLLKEFTTSNLTLGIKRGKNALGLNYSNFGNEFLQIHTAGLGYSMQLGENLQSGIKLNYFYYNAGEYYNKKSVISADFGLAAKLTKELQIGLSIKNPTLSKLDDFNEEKIPTVMQFATGFLFSDQLTISAGVNKSIAYPLSFITAIDYQPNEKIRFIGGIGTQPSLASIGVGINLKLLTLNFSTQLHQILGWSPDFSITYNFE